MFQFASVVTLHWPPSLAWQYGIAREERKKTKKKKKTWHQTWANRYFEQTFSFKLPLIEIPRNGIGTGKLWHVAYRQNSVCIEKKTSRKMNGISIFPEVESSFQWSFQWQRLTWLRETSRNWPISPNNGNRFEYLEHSRSKVQNWVKSVSKSRVTKSSAQELGRSLSTGFLEKAT